MRFHVSLGAAFCVLGLPGPRGRGGRNPAPQGRAVANRAHDARRPVAVRPDGNVHRRKDRRHHAPAHGRSGAEMREDQLQARGRQISRQLRLQNRADCGDDGRDLHRQLQLRLSRRAACHFDPPLHTRASSDIVTEAKWLGPCKPGQKPGDIDAPGLKGMGGSSQMNMQELMKMRDQLRKGAQ